MSGYLEIYHKQRDRVEHSRNSISKVGEGVLVECFKFNMEVTYLNCSLFYTPEGLCISMITIGMVRVEQFYLYFCLFH